MIFSIGVVGKTFISLTIGAAIGLSPLRNSKLATILIALTVG